jgi:hypothetical protein
MNSHFVDTLSWDSKDIMFVAQDTGPQSLPWHNGRLLVVDRSKLRVWFGEYDM